MGIETGRAAIRCRAARWLGVGIGLLLLGGLPAAAQAVPTVPLLTDVTVSSILDSGSHIYVAGRFSRVSTAPLGQAATIDGVSATASAAAAQAVGGQVRAPRISAGRSYCMAEILSALCASRED